jgi:hypothetical protein
MPCIRSKKNALAKALAEIELKAAAVAMLRDESAENIRLSRPKSRTVDADAP